MAANGRMVTSHITIAWDGSVINVPAGTLVDIPPGSALEAAYGPENLADLDPQDAAAITSGTGTCVAN